MASGSACQDERPSRQPSDISLPSRLDARLPRQFSNLSAAEAIRASYNSILSAVRMSHLLSAIESAKAEKVGAAAFSAPWKALLLLTVPVSGALTGFGVQLATSRGSFSLYLPLVLAGLILLFGLAARLLWFHGFEEFRQLSSRRYLCCFLPGLIGGAKYSLQNLTVSMMSSSLFFIIMRTTLIWVAVFEALMLRRLPDKLQAVTLLAVLLSCISSTVQALEEAEDGTMTVSALAVLLAAACALADAVFDTCTDLLGRKFSAGLSGKEKGAELCRIMVALQFFRLPPYACMLVWFDWDDAFGGFDVTTFALTVLPVVLKIPVFQASVFMVGAVKTSMAVSFEIGLSYLLEVVFSLADFVMSKMLAMATLACVLMMSALHHIRLREEVARQQDVALDELKVQVRASARSLSHQPLRKPGMQPVVMQPVSQDDGAGFSV
ncbi:CTK1 [Symbiodinium sp. CCMP2592]|nr:CTK1 [Symbiodinium sp. CCMP2592]